MGAVVPWAFLLPSLLALRHAALAQSTPVYGKDYSGLDYNISYWSSPASKSADHWKAAAIECEILCEND